MFSHFQTEGVRRCAAGALSTLLVLAFLFSALPQAAIAAPPAAQEASCAETHKVVAGDTLSAISAKYDVSVAEIATANNLKEPYTLSVGQELCIPGASGAPTATPTTGSSGSSSTTSSSKDPSMTLSIDESGLLTIVTKNFPTKSSFYVKVAPPGRGNLSYTKIGTLRTKKEGAVSKAFKLPKDFRKIPTIAVCVKNAMTDDQLCQKVSTGFQR